MNSETGELYKDRASAIKAGVKVADLVEINGAAKAVRRVAQACKDAHARRVAKRKAQKASRKRNRRG